MNIQEQLSQLQLPEQESDIAKQLLYNVQTNQAVVGLFGSFSVGKSELLNKLLGREGILPTHTNETTAIVTRIVYGSEDRIELIYHDGHVEEISMEQLRDYGTGGSVEQINKIMITLSSPEWLQQIEFIDTPGRNTKYSAHIEASKQAIIEADAAIYVLPWQGLTLEDIVYLKDLVLYQPNLYFVLNKVDRIEEEQGQSIEEVRQKVENEIFDQLEKKFPVYALSAKTGYNFDQFKEQFIPELVNNITEIKNTRFTHALDQFILSHEKSLQNELNILKLASAKDHEALDDEIRKIEVEQSKLQDQIKRKLVNTKGLLNAVQSEVNDVIANYLLETKHKLVGKLQDKSTLTHSLEDINTMIETELLSTRNKIYTRFEEKIGQVTSDRNLYQLSKLEGTEVQFQYNEPTYDDLQARYEERIVEITEQYQAKKNRLQLLVSEGNQDSASEMEQINQALIELEAQLQEEYKPEYIDDINFDQNKATKVLGYVGKAGDIALSIAAAVATAGVSAGAQIAGKAGAEVAKQTGKQTVKLATKEAVKTTTTQMVKNTGKVLTKEGLKTVGKEVAKQSGKETAKRIGLETLKAAGALASPVETITTNIGQAIDQNRRPEQELDKHHRQQFFMKRQRIEEKYDSLKNELRQLKDAQANNQAVAKNVEQKLLDMEKRQQEETNKLEQSIKRDQEKIMSKHFEKTLAEQLDELMTFETEKYVSWAKGEIEGVYLVLEKTIPTYYEQELSNWREQIQIAKDGFSEEEEQINVRMNEVESQLAICMDIRGQIRHDS